MLPKQSIKFLTVGAAFVLMLSHAQALGAAPSLIIETPSGGEVYALGQSQKVRLDVKTRAKSVKIDLSRDGGTTFELLGTIDNTVKDKTLRNVLQFTVSGPGSTNCLIRASATVSKADVVTLSSSFSIGSAENANIADGSVVTSKIAAGSVSVDKLTSGSASADFVLISDGLGGTSFGPLPTTAITAGSVTFAKVAPFPKAYVVNSTSTPVPTGFATALPFDTDRTDTDGIHDPVTNNTRLTCVTPGLYFITATVAFTGNNTGTRQLFFRRNGSGSIASEVKLATGGSDTTVSTMFLLTAGDYIEATVIQSSGSTLNVDATFGMTLLP